MFMRGRHRRFPDLRARRRPVIVDDITPVLPDMRAEAESLMVDACTVTTSGVPVWDDGLGAYVPGAPVGVYAGRCRVQVPASAPGAPVAGEAEWATMAVVVSIPVAGTGSVDKGATVKVTACTHDAALVSREFTVVGLPLRKTFATARRLQCEGVAR